MCDITADVRIANQKLTSVSLAAGGSSSSGSSSATVTCAMGEGGCAWSASGSMAFDFGSDLVATGSAAVEVTRSAAAGLDFHAATTLTLRQGSDAALWPTFKTEVTLDTSANEYTVHGTLQKCQDAFLSVPALRVCEATVSASVKAAAKAYSLRSLTVGGKMSVRSQGSLAPMLAFIDKPSGLETTFAAAYTCGAELTAGCDASLEVTASVPDFGYAGMHTEKAELAMTVTRGGVTKLAFVGELPLTFGAPALAAGLPWEVVDVRPLSVHVQYDRTAQPSQLAVSVASSFAVTSGDDAEKATFSVLGDFDMATKAGNLKGQLKDCVADVLGVPCVALILLFPPLLLLLL